MSAEKCKEKGIETVVFDRGGFKYHGRIVVRAHARAAAAQRARGAPPALRLTCDPMCARSLQALADAAREAGLVF